jgi:hypothetical protein
MVHLLEGAHCIRLRLVLDTMARETASAASPRRTALRGVETATAMAERICAPLKDTSSW